LPIPRGRHLPAETELSTIFTVLSSNGAVAALTASGAMTVPGEPGTVLRTSRVVLTRD
jgi:hypothetical protein